MWKYQARDYFLQQLQMITLQRLFIFRTFWQEKCLRPFRRKLGLENPFRIMQDDSQGIVVVMMLDQGVIQNYHSSSLVCLSIIEGYLEPSHLSV